MFKYNFKVLAQELSLFGLISTLLFFAAFAAAGFWWRPFSLSVVAGMAITLVILGTFALFITFLWCALAI